MAAGFWLGWVTAPPLEMGAREEDREGIYQLKTAAMLSQCPWAWAWAWAWAGLAGCLCLVVLLLSQALVSII